MRIEVGIKALPGDKVRARNYRAGGVWEDGVVHYTDVSILHDPKERGRGHAAAWHTKYRVLLTRKSNTGNYLFITVGDDGIESLKKKR